MSGIPIPSDLKQIYIDTINNLIDSNWGVNCNVIQPPRKIECLNCILNTLTNISSNKYKSGGPIVFSNGQICPYCNGNGYTESLISETVKMLFYWDASQWAKDYPKLLMPAGTVASKGKFADFQKIFTCDKIQVHQGLLGVDLFEYRKYGEPIPYGIGKDSFFICFWNRV